MPWVLDGAPPQVATSVLALMPLPIREAYRDEWEPAYATLRRWG